MKPNQQNQFIFFFPIFDIGGVEKNFLILSNFFEKKLKNFECFLITYNKNSVLQKNLNKSIKLITPNLNFEFLFRRMKFLFCMLVLFIRCVKYPKCIIFSFQGKFYALLVAWILNKKIVIRSNLAPDAWSGNFVKKKLFKFLLSKSNLIIVNSLDFKKKIKKYYNLNSIKIYNPINHYNRNYFNNCKSKNNFFKKKTINLLNIGRFVKQKNQSEIINAFCKIKNKKKFRLLFIGTGPEKKNLADKIKRNKISNIAKIISSQKNKDYYLKKADIFILSSLNEGLPNVLLEAAINKKYIISSNCPTGPREIIKIYRYGELYKVKSKEKLIKILNKFSENPLLLNKMKKKINLNHQLFDSEFNLNQYYINILKIIRKM